MKKKGLVMVSIALDCINKAKEIICDPNGPTRHHFVMELDTYVFTDASKFNGLSYAVIQYDNNDVKGHPRLVETNSRCLKESKKKKKLGCH